MTKFIFIFSLFTILSCDTVEETYLYDKSDDEYAWAQALAASDCINEASIFTALNGAGNFETSGNLDKIYKVSQDENDNVSLYIKIIDVSATEMKLAIQSASSEGYNKVIIFEKTDHDALMDELKVMACNGSYSSYFSASGLDSNDRMTLTWKKETITTPDSDDDEDDDPDVYYRQKDTYTIDNDLPLIFFYYFGTKTSNIVDTKGKEEVEKVSELTLTEVTDADECDASDSDFNINCDFSDTSALTNCAVAVNAKSYEKHGYSDEIISLTPTSTGTCKLLESAK